MDAAVGPNFASIVAMARWREELVFACSQKVSTTLPLQGKAKAIKWALLLAKNLAVVAVSIETDSMVCHDALIDLPPPHPPTKKKELDIFVLIFRICWLLILVSQFIGLLGRRLSQMVS